MRWWWCVVQMGVATRLFHQHAVDSPPSFQSNSHFLFPRQKRGPFLVIREDILYKITQLHFCKLEAAWIFGCNQNWIQLLSSFRRLRRQILFCFWTQFRAFKSKKALALNQRCLKFNMDNQTAPNIMAKDTYVTHCRGTTFKIKNAPGANRFLYAKPTSSICTLRKWSPRKQIPLRKSPFPLSAEPGVYLLEWYNWPESVWHIKTYCDIFWPKARSSAIWSSFVAMSRKPSSPLFTHIRRSVVNQSESVQVVQGFRV